MHHAAHVTRETGSQVPPGTSANHRGRCGSNLSALFSTSLGENAKLPSYVESTLVDPLWERVLLLHIVAFSEILVSVSSPRFAARLATVQALCSLTHQVLELHRLDEIGVPYQVSCPRNSRPWKSVSEVLPPPAPLAIPTTRTRWRHTFRLISATTRNSGFMPTNTKTLASFMCPALVFRPGLPAFSARVWPSASPACLVVASLLEWALRASRPRQTEDLLALSTPVQDPSLQWNCCGTRSASLLVVNHTRFCSWHCKHYHGTPWRSVSRSVAQPHQPRLAFHQCRRHVRRFYHCEWRIPEFSRNSGACANQSSWELALTSSSWVSTPCHKPNCCRTTCATLPKILPRLRCPRHFCFPSELVRSKHHFGLCCFGLQLEPRKFALDHLGKTDDVDRALRWDGTSTLPHQWNLSSAQLLSIVTFNTASVWFSLWISLAQQLSETRLTSHVVSVALRFARDASCSPGDSWFLANSAVLRSLRELCLLHFGAFLLVLLSTRDNLFILCHSIHQPSSCAPILHLL